MKKTRNLMPPNTSKRFHVNRTYQAMGHIAGRVIGEAGLPERFWAKVKKTESCWMWMGNENHGYGSVTFKNRTYRAHRMTYEAFKGEIPKGMYVDHLCKVTLCVNPQHLEAVTPKENFMRGGGVIRSNVNKTHCPKGHAYDDVNTCITKTGTRRCRQCSRDWVNSRYKPRPKIKITHCPKGHEYTEENSRLIRNTKSCKKCAKAYAAEYYKTYKNIKKSDR